MYSKDWQPRTNEVLSAIHERNNVYDHYAIAAQKRLPGRIGSSTIGHLPNEISRITRFIIHYGATVTVRVISTNHRRSPLVQGGLEIPVEVSVMMNSSETNSVALTKYEELVKGSYKEPVDGTFDDITGKILKELDSDSDNTSDECSDDESEA